MDQLMIDDAESDVEQQFTRDGMNVTTWLCSGSPRQGQWQQYPGRFMFNLLRTYPELRDPATLHMFSGSGAEWGVTTDLRPETGADIVSPFDALPLRDSSMNHVIADPPYADHWQGQWHGDLPKPKHILKEAARIVRPGGLIAILHIIVIPSYAVFPIQRIGIHPVICGPNNAARVLNVFRVTPALPVPAV